MAGKRRERSEWRDLIAQFEVSGQSAREFCAANGLNRDYFYKQHREHRNRSNGFVPVRVRSEGITLQIGSVTVRCSSSTPVGWIADLARALDR